MKTGKKVKKPAMNDNPYYKEICNAFGITFKQKYFIYQIFGINSLKQSMVVYFFHFLHNKYYVLSLCLKKIKFEKFKLPFLN